MKLDLCGELKMNDNGNYIIDKVNLTKVLNKIYYSNHPTLSITVDSNTRRLFSEKGELYLDKDKYGIYCWHINGECLELVLFNNTDSVLRIDVNTYTETEEYIDEIQRFICG